MNFNIRIAAETDIDELEALYDALNDRLAAMVNYPGWMKGVYPVRETAARGIAEGCLYVAICDDLIVGSIILRRGMEPIYQKADWQARLSEEAVLAIYTVVVHPDCLARGIGQGLMDFAVEYGLQTDTKALRLDVYEHNLPAIRLYEKNGFKYIESVDLGLSTYGLNKFYLYEKLI